MQRARKRQRSFYAGSWGVRDVAEVREDILWADGALVELDDDAAGSSRKEGKVGAAVKEIPEDDVVDASDLRGGEKDGQAERLVRQGWLEG